MNEPPNRLTGDHPLAAWLNKLRDYCKSNEIKSVSGGRISSRDSSGTVLAVGESAAGSGLGKCYRVESVQADYLTCKKFNGTTSGGDVFVAKCYELRESTTTCVLKTSGAAAWTATFTFADGDYDDNRKCTADDSSGLEDPARYEKRYVTPPWESAKSLIWAIPVDYSGVTVSGADLKLLDSNAAGRAWSKEFQPPI